VDMDYICVAHWTPFDDLDFHCGACASNVRGKRQVNIGMRAAS
jgi:hypothetical protein